MLCSTSPLGIYLEKNGGHFHPSLEYRTDSFGTSIFSSITIPPQTSVVSCPFALAITPTLARLALTSAFNSETLLQLNDHELMSTYISLHLVHTELKARELGLGLQHYVYVESLPKKEEMRTPAYFSAKEMDLLIGTNLFGAANDRKDGWKDEFKGVKSKLKPAFVKGFLWEHYLYACTIISSRAFPSSLISTTLDPTDSTPILFPGVDTLNHKIGEKVTWNSDVHHITCEGKERGRLEIVLDSGVQAGQQAFNTYGPKSNEELLLGYGFTTKDNPADSITLKLGSLPSNPTTIPIIDLLKRLSLETERFVVGIDSVVPFELLARMRVILANEDDVYQIEDTLYTYERYVGEDENEKEQHQLWKTVVDERISFEGEMEILNSLLDMMEDKYLKVSTVDTTTKGVRKDVGMMIEIYRSSQEKIMFGMIDNLNRLIKKNVAEAGKAGVDLTMEEEEEEED